jgi:hypothetical protein
MFRGLIVQQIFVLRVAGIALCKRLLRVNNIGQKFVMKVGIFIRSWTSFGLEINSRTQPTDRSEWLME